MAISTSRHIGEPQREWRPALNRRSCPIKQRRNNPFRPKFAIRATCARSGTAQAASMDRRVDAAGELAGNNGAAPAQVPAELAVRFRSPASAQPNEQLESPAWYLHRQRNRPSFDSVNAGEVFCTDTFHDGLDASSLKRKVKVTILELLSSADEFGRTAVSGRQLAVRLGVREATITSHLQKARDAELLLTKRRYNNSSVQQLTWPGSGLHPPQPGISPLNTHTWTDGEVAWWSSLDTDSPRLPPWGDGEPPF